MQSTTNKLIFIDAPGYGYAERDKKTIQSWKMLLENYFKESRYTKYVLALVDSKVGLTASDHSLLEFTTHLRKKVVVCLTKCDKANADEVKNTIEQIKQVQFHPKLGCKYLFLTSS